jgi:hypothetical protein
MKQTEFQTDTIRSITVFIDANAHSTSKRKKEKLKDT